MSKIHAELVKATGVQLEDGQSPNDAGHVKKLIRAIADLSDKAWDALSKEAQAWYNTSASNINKKEPPVAFEVEEAPRRRRSSDDEDPAPRGDKYTPKKGDEVEIKTARGKVVKGIVIDPDDAGELVLKEGDEEVGYRLDRIESITPVKAETKEEAPRRRRAADDEPAGPKDPKVGDTVELITAKDAVHVGNVTELDDKLIVIKKADGDEVEFTRERLKSVKVKVEAKPAGDETPRRRASGDDDKGDNKGGGEKSTRAENGDVSVTTRLREIMCEDPHDPLSLEDLGKRLEKEGLKFKDTTLKMGHGDCVKLFKMLKAAGHLKSR